jgi:hypothetical protein
MRGMEEHPPMGAYRFCCAANFLQGRKAAKFHGQQGGVWMVEQQNSSSCCASGCCSHGTLPCIWVGALAGYSRALAHSDV